MRFGGFRGGSLVSGCEVGSFCCFFGGSFCSRGVLQLLKLSVAIWLGGLLTSR